MLNCMTVKVMEFPQGTPSEFPQGSSPNSSFLNPFPGEGSEPPAAVPGQDGSHSC